ncbi:MAG TPA: glycine--tRNA ligase subunit beta, partial [Anaerolineae bacterium]
MTPNATPLSFQDVIMRLQQYWAEHGCLIWQPYSEKVGAGTMNPATVLRVLGPEPWIVAYVEPSYRPDDGRYAENPNRMQMHTQYQVILKPAPANPQELYLGSLAAIGIDRTQHDIRFVEDNWESPALGAWGLGWEVWLDGLEITQFTYFQQAGGYQLDPVAVELTYGLERIIMYLQGVREVWQIDWDGHRTYGDVLRTPEIEHCTYDFEVADVGRLNQMYDLFEAEAKNCLAHKLVIPAHDYVLRCSHTFNLLDARGAIGVTERQQYFARMRDLARQVSIAYVEQREREGLPWLAKDQAVPAEAAGPAALPAGPATPATFYLEIGTEELPTGDVVDALGQLERLIPRMLEGLLLEHGPVTVTGTPRRLVVKVGALAPVQPNEETLVKGPPAERAYDPAGNLTPAALGFARSRGVRPEDLTVRQEGSGRYVYAVVRKEGRPAVEVLAEALPGLIPSIKLGKNMRWNASNVAFSRPIRWLVALLDETLVPFEYAGLRSGTGTRGPRFTGALDVEVPSADAGLPLLGMNQIVVERPERRAEIARQVAATAAQVGGAVPDDPGLLDEVTDLVEYPTALLGHFEERYLSLPRDVLVTVMRKHQRYFPVIDPADPKRLLPYFVAVRNGTSEYLDVVRAGNEGVLRARFADAAFFFEEDRAHKLEEFTPRLATLMFQAKLGSMLDKVKRVQALVPAVAGMLGLDAAQQRTAERAAALFKSDLATQMVVELTSLQGTMGREYARLSGEPEEVAVAIYEHYLPRYQGDALPQTPAGLALAIANHLDSLVGLFAVGLAPTGSADPFGLRREALGLVLALTGSRQSFDLWPALRAAARQMPVPVDEKVLADVLAFIRDRQYGLLREEGLAHDVVSAVLAEQARDPYHAHEAAGALAGLVAAPDWMDTLTAYARCKRIVRALPEVYPLAPQHYTEEAGRALLSAWEKASPCLDGTVEAMGSALRDLREPINRFFADVLVNAEDPAVRQARLALVQRIAGV